MSSATKENTTVAASIDFTASLNNPDKSSFLEMLDQNKTFYSPKIKISGIN